MSLGTSAPLNFTSSPRLHIAPSPRPLVSPSVLHRCALRRLLRVVALAVEEAEVLFAQFGVGDLDLELAEAAVLRAVDGRVGDEVLRAELLLDLGEGRGQVGGGFGEEGAAPRLLCDVAEEVAA